MRLRNTADAYGWPAIALHWLMAAAIFALFALGLWMRSLGYYHPWYHRAPELHQSVGMTVMALLVMRLVWRTVNVQPMILGAPWERLGAGIVHRLHYLLMLMLTVSGYLIPTAEGRGFDVFAHLHVPALTTLSPHQADVNGAVHLYAAWAIMILALLHSLAALKHHFIDRDATLLRMLGVPARS